MADTRMRKSNCTKRGTPWIQASLAIGLSSATLLGVVDTTEIISVESGPDSPPPTAPAELRIDGPSRTALDIPEPLLFDLVRPLGAKKGELEVNVLTLVPLERRLRRSPDAPDELGLVPLSRDRSGIEWAPEIEYALWDGFALEAEFPFEDAHLEALKFGAQWTIGTAFDKRYIHGVQAIWERELQSTTSTATGVYLAGYRWNDAWSVLSMTGFRTELGEGAGNVGGDRIEFLQNTSLFRNLTEKWSVGLETNWALSFRGNSTLVVLPQVQYEASHHLSVQMGAGLVYSRTETLPILGLRVIWTR